LPPVPLCCYSNEQSASSFSSVAMTVTREIYKVSTKKEILALP
jgi:hypothetical protein